MYKLLTTAAVIMAVASPSIANDWTGHKDLVNKLEGTYNALDGETGFANLQGAYRDTDDALTNNGQLSNFFDLVDQGVTYITLEVDETTHQITPGINNGVAFSEISTAKDELVNRVNYDLFVSTDGTAFDNSKGAEYVSVKGQGLIIDGVPANGTGDNEYTTNQNGGYAGVKITNLVETTNEVNNYLVDSGTSATQNTEFQTAFGNGAGTIITGVDGEGNNITVDLAADFFGQITDLNTAIGLASDTTDVDGNVTGTGGFFENIDAGNVSETNINQFAIPAYNSYKDIGTVALGHSTISNWANGIYNYATANGGSGTFTDATGTATVDAAANTVTYGGKTYNVAADGTLTEA